MADAHYSSTYVRAISPAAAATDNTPFVSQILDCANHDVNEIAVLWGSLADADATFAFLLEESADSAMAGANTVSAEDSIGTQAAAGNTFAGDDTVTKIGYKGVKRYIRATITPAANTGNAFVAAVWIQSGARVKP